MAYIVLLLQMEKEINKVYPENINTLLIGYATGKQMHTRILTTGATAAPIARPYLEQTA